MEQYSVDMMSVLEGSCRNAVKSRDFDAVRKFAVMYRKLGKIVLFEKCFRETYTLTALEDVLMQNSSAFIDPNQLFDLPGILDKVFTLLMENRKILKIFSEELYGDNIHKFWVNVLLIPVLQWLIDDLSIVFEPANPDNFHKVFD